MADLIAIAVMAALIGAMFTAVILLNYPIGC